MGFSVRVFLKVFELAVAACVCPIGSCGFHMQTALLWGPGDTAAAGLSPCSAPNKQQAAACHLSGTHGRTFNVPVACTLVMPPPNDARG